MVRFGENTENARVFEELVGLYERRQDPAGDDEFPRMHPKLPSYRFADVFPDPDLLRKSLSPERVESLRRDLNGLGSGAGGGAISYSCPWFSSEIIEDESVDVACSQAVLEHVDDLEGTYTALFRWMKPGAMMSHQIDFKCHGLTDAWNGHLSYSDPVWKMIRGRFPYFLNRQVLSNHLALQERAGFRILVVTPVKDEGGLPRRRLARRYRGLSDEDLTTSSAHVISAKP